MRVWRPAIPASGSATFTLVGQMTLHGVSKEQTWNVTATRQGSQLSGTATTSFKFGDYGVAAPRVSMVLSVVDDIRLEVAMVAAASS
jgi:polyisoprenoid-binding protein YceI